MEITCEGLHSMILRTTRQRISSWLFWQWGAMREDSVQFVYRISVMNVRFCKKVYIWERSVPDVIPIIWPGSKQQSTIWVFDNEPTPISCLITEYFQENVPLFLQLCWIRYSHFFNTESKNCKCFANGLGIRKATKKCHHSSPRTRQITGHIMSYWSTVLSPLSSSNFHDLKNLLKIFKAIYFATISSSEWRKCAQNWFKVMQTCIKGKTFRKAIQHIVFELAFFPYFVKTWKATLIWRFALN